MLALVGRCVVRAARIESCGRLVHWAAVAVTAAIAVFPSFATAKTPGTVHCYGGLCHRINSVDEMDAMVGRRGMLQASYYDDCRRDRFNPCGLTSSGAIFRPDLPDNAASPIFPDGTILLTYNPATRLAAVLRVTSTGPYRGDRTLDVSRATAEHLGFLKQGIAPLEVVVLKSPEEHEARYKKLRAYAPVPGYLGKFLNFEAAHDAAMARLQLQAARVTVAAVPLSAPDSASMSGDKSDIDRWWPRGLAMDVALSSHAVDVSVSRHAAVAMPAVADAGPQTSVIAVEVTGIDAVEPLPVYRWSLPDDVKGKLKDRVWLFIDAARQRARLRRTDDANAASSSLPSRLLRLATLKPID